MQRRESIRSAAFALGIVALAGVVLAQQPPPRGAAAAGQPQGACRGGGPGACDIPPALMFRETWKMPPYTGELTDEKRRATQIVVANPQLELKLYGPNSRDVLAYEHEGRFDLWTGISAPAMVMLRDRSNFAELSSLARLRVIVRTQGLHVLYPVVKLADGTFLAGSRLIDTAGDFLHVDISFNNLRWWRLNPDKVVTSGQVMNPDLSKVDEIGLVDMMGGGGHGAGGWVNISTIELYARPVTR